MEKMKIAYKIFVLTSEGKRPHGRPRRRWEDNVRLDLNEIVWEGVKWIRLAQNRDEWRAVMNSVMNFLV
jgi:hypothetical protein